MKYLNFIKQKGAVFGMDARIALVVFSILSVVGAYYTVDRVSKAQENSVVDQVKVLRDAAKQNIADNGFDYKLYSTASNSNIFGLSLNASNDLNRGKNNYAYIKTSDSKSTDGQIYIQTPIRNIIVDSSNLHTSTTKDAASTNTSDCSNTLKNCYYFIKLDEVDEESYKLLEAEFDGDTVGFSDTTAKTTGFIVAPSTDSVNDEAIVYVYIGERS